MKTIWIKALVILSIVIFALPNCVQERPRKTNVIIDSLKIVDSQKLLLIESGIHPLKYEATGNDSLALIELENMLTEQEIRSRIVQVFDTSFTDSEINTLYGFIASPLYHKYFNFITSQAIPNQFKDIATELDRISGSMKEKKELFNEFESVYVDRPDGFYATIDYDPNVEKDKIKLEEKPSITKDDIQSVEKDVDPYGMQFIGILLTRNGAKKFYTLTKNNISKPIAIVVDKHIISMPVVTSEISEGRATIRGNFSTAEIEEIIKRLKK